MGSSHSITEPSPVLVLFDGVCNLCSGAVQFIIKRDSQKRFCFASLQSNVGKQQLKKFGIDTASLHSIIVIHAGHCYERSDAALLIASFLDAPWRWFKIGKILPKFFRDGLYNFVAKNRYKLFGKRDECMIPTADLKARFIEM